MIMFGKNILSAIDKLMKVQEEYFFNSIIHPKPQIEALIRQLRIVYAMDTKQYAIQKRSLPYIVCGMFNPPFRRKENFGYTEYFLLDIDHISEKQLSIEDIRLKIQKDSQVLMCFASPSEDGLKVMFKLNERCYDSGLYSIFYKEFARRFSLQYHLEQNIDIKTSDVSRACFISIDPNAYYNPFCEKVEIKKYVNIDNPVSVSDIKQELNNYEKTQRANKGDSIKITDPDIEIIQKIKSKLNPNKEVVQYKQPAFVPKQLNEIITDLKKYIEDNGIIVYEIIDIQYAKKLRMRLGLKEAEVNIFFGHKGFSVVITPRRGTNVELNKLSAMIIQSYLNTH